MLHRLTLAIDDFCCNDVNPVTVAAIDSSATTPTALTHSILSVAAPAPAETSPSSSYRETYGMLSVVVLLGVASLVVYQSKLVRFIKKPRLMQSPGQPSADPTSSALIEVEPAAEGRETAPQPLPDYSTLQTMLPAKEALHPTEELVQPSSELTRLAKVNICDELIKELHSLDANQRQKAIWELGQRGDSRAVQPLLDLLIDTNSQQRSLILAAISEIGVRTLKPMNQALLLSLQDESPDVRKNAIRDATRLYDLMTHLSQLLHHATNDSDQEVQETAVWAMHQLDRIRIAPTTELTSQLSSYTTQQDAESLIQDAPESYS
ncbi:MAG: HEAT repeat domain-containing protein [Leptolyngbyaceae cyanobacterium SL_7_1]|nr:HEAT repeat domain-containing protein [Leptolyngbyaceae cyanobacterium SL_7_1]